MGGSTSQNTAGVKKRFVPVCLAPISGSIACLCSGRAADWRGMLSNLALLQYGMHESNFDAIIGAISFRKRGFHNEVFASLEKVVERLCDTICSLSNQISSSISGRDWIIKAFN